MMMNSLHSVLILFLLTAIETKDEVDQGSSDFCDSQDCSEQLIDDNRYTFADNYLSQISNAEASYVPCQGCACFDHVLDRDLSEFKVISEADLNKVKASVRHVVTYQVISGKLYRSKDPLFPMRCLGIEYFLKKLIDEGLDDTELLVNTHDWPFISKRIETDPLPLFSFSKTEEFWDITYPAWAFWAGGPAIKLHPRGIGRWDLMRESLSKASQKFPWSQKLDVGFFRGSRTSAERDNLILLSRRDPVLVDAKYTKNQAWKSVADTLGDEPGEEVALEDHCQYRYLFNFRGVAASFRFKHLFLCGSVVIHVGDEWTEFFYPALKAWIHYVPLASNASQEEIENIMTFLKTHPEVAEKIAKTGQDFIENNLGMDEIFCYWRRLLKAYTDKLSFQPKINPDFVEIPLH